jgi:hypothetical protein
MDGFGVEVLVELNVIFEFIQVDVLVGNIQVFKKVAVFIAVKFFIRFEDVKFRNVVRIEDDVVMIRENGIGQCETGSLIWHNGRICN